MADILTCHNRKGAGVIDNNNKCVSLKCVSSRVVVWCTLAQGESLLAHLAEQSLIIVINYTCAFHAITGLKRKAF